MIPNRFNIAIDCPACDEGFAALPALDGYGVSCFKVFCRGVSAVLAGLLATGCHHQSTALPVAGADTNSLVSLEQQEKKAYMTNFLFNHFHVERNDFGGVWEASVSFGLKNNGDRPVAGLTVTIYLVDTNGAVCRRENIVPFTNQTNAPLLPGQTWDCDLNNPFILADVPDSWQGGYDYSQVTDMQFK